LVDTSIFVSPGYKKKKKKKTCKTSFCIFCLEKEFNTNMKFTGTSHFFYSYLFSNMVLACNGTQHQTSMTRRKYSSEKQQMMFPIDKRQTFHVSEAYMKPSANSGPNPVEGCRQANHYSLFPHRSAGTKGSTFYILKQQQVH